VEHLNCGAKEHKEEGNWAQYKNKESNVDNSPHLSTNYKILGIIQNKHPLSIIKFLSHLKSHFRRSLVHMFASGIKKGRSSEDRSRGAGGLAV